MLDAERVTLMLDRLWVRLGPLSLRLRRFSLFSSSAGFFMGWLGVVLVAARQWHATSTFSHLWAILLLLASLRLWVLLLPGKTRPGSAILILGAILMSSAILWSQYLR